MKNLVIIALIFGLSTSLFGQQESQFTQFYLNPYMHNPAASGMTSMIDLNLGFRQQWAGIDGAPRTFFATGHSQIRIGKKSDQVLQEFKPDGAFFSAPQVSTGGLKHVIGGRAFSDQMGPFNKTSVGGSYSFHFPLIKSINMSFGLSGGWSNFGLNSSNIKLYHQTDGIYANLMATGGNQNFFDMQAGTMIYNRFFEVGYSMSQVINNRYTVDNITTDSRFERHHFVYLAGNIDFNDTWMLSPALFMRSVKGAPFNFEGVMRIQYKRMAWLGVGYRNTNSLTFSAGANFAKNFRLSYSFDAGVGQYRTIQSGGSHEIMIGFIIGKNRKLEKEIDKSVKEAAE